MNTWTIEEARALLRQAMTEVVTAVQRSINEDEDHS